MCVRARVRVRVVDLLTLCFAPRRVDLVAVSRDGFGQLSRSLFQPFISAVAFSTPGIVVVGSSSCQTLVWCSRTGVRLQRYSHSLGVNFIAASRDGQFIAAALAERIQLITIWSGKQLGLQFGRCSAGLTFDDSSQFLALGDVFGKVRIIAAERGTEVAVFTAGDRCAVDAVAFQPGTTLLVCATNRTILAWNVAADCSQQVWTVTLDRQSLKSLAWGAMGLTLAVACVEGVQVFDVTTGAPRVQAQMEHRDVRALNPRVGVAMSFDERPLIAYACRTRPLELLLCPSAPRWSLAEHKGWIRANNHVADYVEFIMMLAHRLALSEAADGLDRIPALPLEMWCGILSFLSAFDMRSHCY